MDRSGTSRLFRLLSSRRATRAQDLDDEMRLHLELRVEQLIAEGLPEAEARAEARRRFGAVDFLRREAAQRDSLLARQAVFADLGRDLRGAVRGLKRNPMFSVTATIVLAFGIGATTAIWSFVDPILFAPLPYPDSQRVVTVREIQPSGKLSNIGFATYDDVARRNESFAAVAAVGTWSPILTGELVPERLAGLLVSPNYFSVLGVRPHHGRTFLPDDDVVGEERAVMLSHSLWSNRFGADPEILSRVITLNGASCRVIGVMPAEFEDSLEPASQVWTPLRYDLSRPWACRTCRHLRMVARLLPSATVANADQEMNVLSAALFAEYPTEYAAPGMRVVPLKDEVVREARPALLAILGAVALVLAITCANVAHLILARDGRRRSDLAVRSALGATRWRVFRSLMVESLVLAALGGALGTAVAIVGVRLLIVVSPRDIPRLDHVTIDAGVLSFALVLTALVGLVCGLVPAFRLSGRRPWRGLNRGAGRTLGGSRASRAALVIAEVALTLVLLIGAGLLLRSLDRLVSVPPGFDSQGVLSLQLQVAGPRYEKDEATWAFFDQVLDRLRALPGVLSAAYTSQLPLSGDFDSYGVHFEAFPNPNPEEDPSAYRYAVSPTYLETMRIPILRGRGLSPSDDAQHPAVVLVNRSLARQVFGESDPLGQQVRVGSSEGVLRTIVGVVGDTKQISLAGDVDSIFLPETQWPWADTIVSLVVRTDGDPGLLAGSIREAVRSLDSNAPLTRIATMSQLVAATTAHTRFAMVLFEAFAALALSLAAVGIFGVLAGLVAERRNEIGVRAALGATRRSVVGLVVRHGLLMTAAGAALGLLVSVAFGHLLEGLLFGISSFDPVTYLAVTTLVAAVAMIASWVPARRATRINPVEALRSE